MARKTRGFSVTDSIYRVRHLGNLVVLLVSMDFNLQ